MTLSERSRTKLSLLKRITDEILAEDELSLSSTAKPTLQLTDSDLEDTSGTLQLASSSKGPKHGDVWAPSTDDLIGR